MTEELTPRGWAGPRLDLVATVVLALAAVATAWSGFQSAIWSGVQADNFARAAAFQTQSGIISDEAMTLKTFDVVSFGEWLISLDAEIRVDPTARPVGTYEPREGAASTVIYERFRDEFRVALDAWLATQPLMNRDAPRTPFDMPEYQLAKQAESDRLSLQAQESAEVARQAMRRSDQYVLLGVLFSTVLLFCAVGAKARTPRIETTFVLLATSTLLVGLAFLAILPVRL